VIPGGRRVLSILLAGAAFVAGAVSMARATTWSVFADPSNPVDRVGFIVNQAASGDSILIGPGTYYEHMDLSFKGLTIIGIEGAAATILDGGREIPYRCGSIICKVGRDPGDLVVKGLTFVNGRGNDASGEDGGGGAIYWAGDDQSRFEVAECVFRSNSATTRSLHCGGAVWLGPCKEIRFSSCIFEQNLAGYRGGCIRIESRREVSIVGCRFRLLPLVAPPVDLSGAAILYEGSGPVLFRDNEISSSDSRVTEALTASGGSWTIVGNRFLAEAGGAAEVSLMPASDEGATNGVRFELRDNLFWTRSSAPPGHPGYVFVEVPSDGSLALLGNTFARSEVHVGNYGSVTCRQNIFDHGPLWLVNAMTSVDCNDFWPDSVRVIYGPGQSLEGNLRADPIFCDEPTGNLSISSRSPCAEENAPEGCGRIGALTTACTAQATRFTSWGKLRALFR
jgi:hypothetical protein